MDELWIGLCSFIVKVIVNMLAITENVVCLLRILHWHFFCHVMCDVSVLNDDRVVTVACTVACASSLWAAQLRSNHLD